VNLHIGGVFLPLLQRFGAKTCLCGHFPAQEKESPNFLRKEWDNTLCPNEKAPGLLTRGF
jgi:hypothetical protein